MRRVVSKSRGRCRPRWPELFRLIVAGQEWRFVLVDGAVYIREEGVTTNCCAMESGEEVHVTNRQTDKELKAGLGEIIVEILSDRLDELREQSGSVAA